MLVAKTGRVRLPSVTLPTLSGRIAKKTSPITPGSGVSNLLLENGAALLLESGGVILAESRIRQLNIQ